MFIREMSVNIEKYTQKENKDDILLLVPTHNPLNILVYLSSLFL